MLQSRMAKAKELLGELPKDIETDSYLRDKFLNLLDGTISRHGEEWVKEHRVMINSGWDYVATLV